MKTDNTIHNSIAAQSWLEQCMHHPGMPKWYEYYTNYPKCTRTRFEVLNSPSWMPSTFFNPKACRTLNTEAEPSNSCDPEWRIKNCLLGRHWKVGYIGKLVTRINKKKKKKGSVSLNGMKKETARDDPHMACLLRATHRQLTRRFSFFFFLRRGTCSVLESVSFVISAWFSWQSLHQPSTNYLWNRKNLDFFSVQVGKLLVCSVIRVETFEVRLLLTVVHVFPEFSDVCLTNRLTFALLNLVMKIYVIR